MSIDFDALLYGSHTGLNVLPFLALNATDGVETEEVGHFDDGVSHAILVPQGFHFGNTLQNIIFVREFTYKT